MKKLPPLENIALALGVVVLAIIEAKFAWAFWGSFAGEESSHATDFRIFGVTVVLVELVLLIVATNGALRGFPILAWIARLVFIPVMIGNFICGAAAITTFTANDVLQRQAEVARYENASLTAEETKVRIASLRAGLEKKELNLPPDALQSLVSEMEKLIEASGYTGWRAARLAERNAALATAKEIERLEREVKTADGERLDSVRPHEVPPYLDTLVTVASWAGFVLEPEQVRNGLSMLLAVTLRLLLSFGWWFALGPYSRARDGERSPLRSKPAKDDFRKRALALWKWPKSWTAPLKPVPASSGFGPGGSPAPVGPMQASPPMQSTGSGRQPPQPPPTQDRSADGKPEKPGRDANPRQRPPRRKPTARSAGDGRDPLDDLDPVE